MRRAITLQPTITVSSETFQEPRFAADLVHAVAGIALVNVYRNTSSAAVNFALETASQTGLRLDSTNPFWLTVGTGSIAASTTGLVTIAITDLGEVVRWHVSTLNNAVDFSILLRLFDRNPS